ncbi:MAG: 50S ribosomal protein L25/general stress protein Ctc [Rhodocyclaceae bacterium]|nr:50S ribosomal protein L25/general stress protein Ctc [Rhodocyclaceae bacterium]
MQIEFNATKREAKGTGASRRLRRDGGVPGIIYGADQPAVQIVLDHNEIYHLLRKEAFHASILTASVDGQKTSVLLRDTQWHPFRQQVLHVDFQRVKAGEKIHIKVPLHFVNDEIAPGVKLQGGLMTHVMNEIDVTCLPSQLPEFIEVDLKDVQAGEAVHVSHITLPEGVEVVLHGEDDPVVVSCMVPRGGLADDAEAEGGAEAADGAEGNAAE